MNEEEPGRSVANEAVAAILVMKGKAEELLKAIELANQKANSEAGFAFNAKETCEAHAREVSRLKGTVEADVAAITAARPTIEAAAKDAAHAKHSAETDARDVAEARKGATGGAEQVERARVASDANATDLANLVERARTETSTITAAKGAAEAAVAAIQLAQQTSADSLTKIKSEEVAVSAAATEGREKLGSITEGVQLVDTTYKKVIDYENELARLSSEIEALRAKIEGLLPGATSAGLASAFENQKARFTSPQKWWLRTFVACLVLLFIVGGRGFSSIIFGDVGASESWDSIWRHFVSRLPLVIPLVWLAIYAGRNYSMALRVQEDYAFKEALSRAFEGYKREMGGITDSDPEHPSALGVLCRNLLAVLDQRPGRIYEGAHDDVTPVSAMTKAVGDLIDKARGAGQKPGL